MLVLPALANLQTSTVIRLSRRNAPLFSKRRPPNHPSMGSISLPPALARRQKISEGALAQGRHGKKMSACRRRRPALHGLSAARVPPAAGTAPGPQHRGGDSELLGNLAQRPATARQLCHCLSLKLVRELPPRRTLTTARLRICGEWLGEASRPGRNCLSGSAAAHIEERQISN
jgi:hypothetical protein